MSGKGQTYIRMDELSVGYNGKALIRDICIDINKGEIVTLIGPNGAGKSTILKSITRQLALISGKVIFDDKNLKTISPRDLSQKMAVVLTERLKTDLLTCYDIVASGRYPYTGKLGLLSEEDERMVDEAMAVVHATELGPKDFNAISDGQRQRVLLARAICQDPEIIVLDEGKIAGKGTHEELLATCEIYREIALSQLSEEELGRAAVSGKEVN